MIYKITLYRKILCVLLSLFIIIFFSSCYIVKQYNTYEKPFVKKIDISISDKAKQSLSIQNVMFENLSSQIEPSLDPELNKRVYFGVITVVKRPPILDSLKILSSINNIKEYCKQNGYLEAEVNFKTNIKKYKKKYLQSNILFNVKLNALTTIDQVHINVPFTPWQNILSTNKLRFLPIQQNTPYNTTLFYESITDIVKKLKDNGYCMVNIEDFRLNVDTFTTYLHSNLISKIINPIYKPNPLQKQHKANIEFYLKDDIDSSIFKLCILKKNFIIPYLNSNTDSILKNGNDIFTLPFEDFKSKFSVHKNIFIKPQILSRFNYLTLNDLFLQTLVDKTTTKYYQTNVWQWIDIKTLFQGDTIINGNNYQQMHIIQQLMPYKKYNTLIEIGSSFNNPIGASAANLINNNRSWGSYLNFSFSIRNAFKRAIETKLSLNGSLESFFANNLLTIQNTDIAVGYSNNFPWLLFAPNKIHNNINLLNNTIINLSVGLNNRLNYYDLVYINSYMNWVIQNLKYNFSISIKPINFSFTFINKYLNFLNDQKQNLYLRYGFNEGLVAGITLSFNKTFNYKYFTKHISYLRLNTEESGLTWGYLLDTKQQIFRFIKIDASLIHGIRFKNNSLWGRLFIGYGRAFGDDPLKNKTLPFFKQFFAGGANSMRAWGPTRLGLGSSNKLSNTSSFQDQLGDIQLETNIEYRIKLLKFNSFHLESALFADIGNIWLNAIISDKTERSVFSFNNLYRDIAIALGTGLRLNISFFVFRIDWGIKAKDPAYDYLNSQWFNKDNLQFSNTAIQFGIGYPF